MPSFYINLEFSVLNVDQVIATARTNEDAFSPGQVFFTRLPEPASGAYAVVANVVEGERTLAVYCDQDFGNGTFEVVPVRVAGDRMDQELGMGAGDTLRCSWFVEWNPQLSGTHPPESPDSPDQEPDPAGPGQITGLTLLHYACDAGFDPQAGTGDRNTACTGVGKPAFTYTISINDQPVSTMNLETGDGTRGRGEIYSTDDVPLPAGTLEIALDPVPGWSPTWVRCESDSLLTGNRIVEPEIVDNTISLEVAADELLTCDWFNVETAAEAVEDDGDTDQTLASEQEEEDTTGDGSPDAGTAATAPSVTLQFWTCPEGVDPGTDPVDLEQACAVETVERSFMLTVDGVTTGETIAGSTTWQLQDLVFAADIGAGPTTAVSCAWTWTEGADQDPATAVLENGLLTVTLANPDTAVSCNWFIFPQ